MKQLPHYQLKRKMDGKRNIELQGPMGSKMKCLNAAQSTVGKIMSLGPGIPKI